MANSNSNRSNSFYTIIILFLIIIIITILYYFMKKDDTKIIPKRVHIVGGCKGTRYGCCPNGITPRADVNGSNC